MQVTVNVNQIGQTTSEGIIRNHKVLIDRPESKGGDDQGAMGGELLLASLGGCFMSNMLAAIEARAENITGVDNVSIAITGTLASSPSRFSAIHMDVVAKCDDEALLSKLVTISERSCIVANTLKDAVDLTISCNASSVTSHTSTDEVLA